MNRLVNDEQAEAKIFSGLSGSKIAESISSRSSLAEGKPEIRRRWPAAYDARAPGSDVGCVKALLDVGVGTQEPMVRRLFPGGNRIRTIGPAAGPRISKFENPARLRDYSAVLANYARAASHSRSFDHRFCSIK
jgi:hypothetical protein